ncbi:MAG: SUMF1/EgtB/PvdO family nonheme iron enzyme [Treponema sp.]|nr:SUMF1/EgtB/PvdO family nonheme iron enzyme [Treponema sp.]
MLRGGSWDYAAGFLRSSQRGNDDPSVRGGAIGFRVVRP